jgi:acyl-CoA reductase-like NAD-dependent aldehyde dehydrogenase
MCRSRRIDAELDPEDALTAAERRFAAWRKTSPAKRSQIILKVASLIRQRSITWQSR